MAVKTTAKTVKAVGKAIVAGTKATVAAVKELAAAIYAGGPVVLIIIIVVVLQREARFMLRFHEECVDVGHGLNSHTRFSFLFGAASVVVIVTGVAYRAAPSVVPSLSVYIIAYLRRYINVG